MPRSRSGGGEVGFGSDSFLDIIANIVGILIILIVVAGVRVSQAPPPVVEPAIEPESPAAPAAFAVAPSSPELLPDAVIATAPLPGPAVIPDLARDRYIPPPPEPIPISPELERRIRDLRFEVASLDTAFADDRTAYRTEVDGANVARAELTAAEADLAEQLHRVTTTAADVRKKQGELARTADLVVDLRKRVEEKEKPKSTATPVRHRTTAVSKVVGGSEIHFRLHGNRVAAIPLEDLLAELKGQIERQKSWLVKFRAHQGVVGPIDGFELKYVVERVGLSSVERLQGNAGFIRIAITRWELVPTDAVRTETFAEAMRAGSRFRAALGRAPADAALTLWTYPDSFDIYRRLQAVAHENDFTVAGRPLPEGIPIAGSPSGSRSSGQ